MPPAYGFTVPIPLAADMELEQQLGNRSSNWGSPNCSRCPNTTSIITDPQQLWTEISHDILFIAFPIVIGSGMFLGLLNLIVIIRQIKVSNDGYLLGLVTASVMLLASGGIIQMQDYVGYSHVYQYMYGYIRSIHDWFWYTALWILLVMALERSMTVTQNRTKSMCSTGQAVVVTLLIYGVCLVSALPQFWEHEVIETFDYGTNQSYAITQLSAAAHSPEYQIMYYWYTVSITVFLPYPILIVLVIFLAKGMKHSQHSRRRLSIKHGSGNILNRKVTEEINVTRLFVVLILLYILLTGPLTILRLLDRLVPKHILHKNDDLYDGLTDIFQFMFYFYFAIEFFIFLSYSDRFRNSLCRTCCWCCLTDCGRDHRRQRRAKQSKNREYSSH